MLDKKSFKINLFTVVIFVFSLFFFACEKEESKNPDLGTLEKGPEPIEDLVVEGEKVPDAVVEDPVIEEKVSIEEEIEKEVKKTASENLPPKKIVKKKKKKKTTKTKKKKVVKKDKKADENKEWEKALKAKKEEARKRKERERLAAEKKKIADLLAKQKGTKAKDDKLAMVTDKNKKDSESKKAFAPVDLATPKNVKVSSAAKTALSKDDKPSKEVKTQIKSNSSDAYKNGMAAYSKKNYSSAIKSFSQLPKPKSKKKGPKIRDEYVSANYHLGLAYQRTGKLKSAVKAYGEVLQFEPYFPVCRMNQGICYVELRKFARADRAFKAVVRDQNRIPPEQYDDIMQRTRYFWALTWTRMYKYSKGADKKKYYMRQAMKKWTEYKAWFGGNKRYAKYNNQAENYLKTLQNL